jgi:hypothetical protein
MKAGVPHGSPRHDCTAWQGEPKGGCPVPPARALFARPGAIKSCEWAQTWMLKAARLELPAKWDDLKCSPVTDPAAGDARIALRIHEFEETCTLQYAAELVDDDAILLGGRIPVTRIAAPTGCCPAHAMSPGALAAPNSKICRWRTRTTSGSRLKRPRLRLPTLLPGPWLTTAGGAPSRVLESRRQVGS